MCGIVGYIGQQEASEVILEGLKRLEYRGYDSSGIAVIRDQKLSLLKKSGKLSRLADALKISPLKGTVGIGHTRWATHGKPSDENAHPHVDCTGDLVVVHNGIIENFLPLRESLLEKGHKFISETDTEILAHLIESHYKGDLVGALRTALKEIKGAYAIVVAHARHDQLVAVRTVSPLVVGIGEGENFLASDVPALLPYTRQMVFLQDGEMAILSHKKVEFTDLDGNPIHHKPTTVDWNPVQAEKGGYEHFMLKEIFEQPQVIQNTIGGRLMEEEGTTLLELNDDLLKGIDNIKVVACGTAYYAGLAGKYLLESIAKIPVEVNYASEYRYSDPIITPRTLVMGVSQSGETIDTLEGLREAKRKGAHTLGIINAKGSTMTREVDQVLYIHAGPEIGVASTKAYTAMLAAFALLSIHLGVLRGTLDKKRTLELMAELRTIPRKMEEALEEADNVYAVAKKFAHVRDFLYLGRGVNFPTAMEGALKLKEISYIHAEGYASGEMKHGPIALIDEKMPVVVIATESALKEKVVSNLQEVKARDGIIIAVVNKGDSSLDKLADYRLSVPVTTEALSPLLNIVPLQLLAYAISKHLGLDVDQPRNLAKSVTVE